MKKIPKPLLVISIAVLVLATVFMLISLFSTNSTTKSQNSDTANTSGRPIPTPYTDRVADVDPIELPSDVAGNIGFQPKAVDTLTERFVLRNVEIGDNSIIYYYQTHERTDGERLMLICNQMSEQDYTEGLPGKNFENLEYNGLTLTYMERTLLYVPDDYVISEGIQKNIDDGIIVVEYGNTLDEMLTMSSISWYENGIKYQLQMRNNNITQDELFEMAQIVINAD